MSPLEAHVKAAVLDLSAELMRLSGLKLKHELGYDEFIARWNEARDKATAGLLEIMRLERVKLLQPLDN